MLCARKHRCDEPETDDALTVKPDHPMVADHAPRTHTWALRPKHWSLGSKAWP